MRTCVPNLVMICPAVLPSILDRPTHTQNLYYIDIDIMNRQLLCNQRNFFSHDAEMNNKGILHLHLTISKAKVSRAYQVIHLSNGGWTCSLYDMR